METHLTDLARAFRVAIEHSDLSEDPVLRRFPKGACGDSSLLLAKFLREHGFDGIEYVLTRSQHGHGPCGTHAWLEVGGFIVDVTADQFACNPGPAVVVTQGREWHSHFPKEEDRHSHSIEDFDESRRWRLLDVYAAVLTRVPRHLGGGGAG
jgi:hypothetical protein